MFSQIVNNEHAKRHKSLKLLCQLIKVRRYQTECCMVKWVAKPTIQEIVHTDSISNRSRHFNTLKKNTKIKLQWKSTYLYKSQTVIIVYFQSNLTMTKLSNFPSLKALEVSRLQKILGNKRLIKAGNCMSWWHSVLHRRQTSLLIF